VRRAVVYLRLVSVHFTFVVLSGLSAGAIVLPDCMDWGKIHDVIQDRIGSQLVFTRQIGGEFFSDTNLADPLTNHVDDLLKYGILNDGDPRFEAAIAGAEQGFCTDPCCHCGHTCTATATPTATDTHCVIKCQGTTECWNDNPFGVMPKTKNYHTLGGDTGSIAIEAQHISGWINAGCTQISDYVEELCGLHAWGNDTDTDAVRLKNWKTCIENQEWSRQSSIFHS
jgi:hypothetical protein